MLTKAIGIVRRATSERPGAVELVVELDGKEAQQMLRLVEALEDNDDVQNVYANFDISMEEMEKLM